MQDVRAAALRGGMSDAQRKEAAASMAMRLFVLLGAAGEDEGEGEEDEGEGE